jgi:hypothetical protein
MDQSKFIQFNSHNKSILNVSTNKDFTKLFTLSVDNTIKIWSLIIESASPNLKLIKIINLNDLNFRISFTGKDGWSSVKNLITIDSSDNFFIVNNNRVYFIETTVVSISEFSLDYSKLLIPAETLEIWNASHSSILLGYCFISNIFYY